MRSFKWSVGPFCGLAVFASSSLFAAIRPTKYQPGIHLAKLNQSLFNDLNLVERGSLGMMRSDSLYMHTGLPYDRLTSTQKEIVAYRKKMSKEGLRFREALLIDPVVLTGVLSWPYSPKPSKFIICYPMQHDDIRLQSEEYSKLQDGRTILSGFYRKVHAHRFTAVVGRTTVVASPIKFEHKECFKCHRDYKIGDTIAVYLATYQPRTEPKLIPTMPRK